MILNSNKWQIPGSVEAGETGKGIVVFITSKETTWQGFFCYFFETNTANTRVKDLNTQNPHECPHINTHT